MGDDSADAWAETLRSDSDAARSHDGAPDAHNVADSLSGTKLDHFEVLGLLGHGGMGAVYEAWDGSLDRPVAIKVLRDEISARSDQHDRFLREARAQARLSHPSVVHIYHIGHRPRREGDAAPSLYFAMERIDGESLDQLPERGELLDPEDARRIMIDVAEALRAAKDAGIVHRDVKPSNLLRTSGGRVKIADFGLAKPIREDVEITQDGALVGSPLYMAPEQARGEKADHRADMYSLGATFHHLLVGRPPFTGPTGLAVITKHLTEDAPPVRRARPEVPRPLAAIVDRLLSKKPTQRYATYEELLAALEAAAPAKRSYAGFWTRAAAVLIDYAVSAALLWALGWLGLVLHGIHVVLGHAYFGQTLAKYFLRIQVHRPNGDKIGLWRSSLRAIVSLWMPLLAGATIVLTSGVPELRSTIEELRPQNVGDFQNLLWVILISNVFLTLLWASGLAIAAFHPRKCALHDLVADSVVTYKLPR